MRDRPVISQLEDDRELLNAPVARPPIREPLRCALGPHRGLSRQNWWPSRIRGTFPAESACAMPPRMSSATASSRAPPDPASLPPPTYYLIQYTG